MSLIDNDSVSGNRSTPSLNSNDEARVRKAHNTYGNTLRRAGSAVKQFMRFGQGVIDAKDADNKTSFFIGYEPTISTRPIIRIAKDTYDALTASDDQLIFNSEQNVFKIVGKQSGVATIPALVVASGAFTATSTDNVYAHGLGYVPAVLAFVDLGSSFIQMPYTSTFGPGLGGVGFIKYYIQVDSTNVHIICGVSTYGSSAGTIPAGGDKPVTFYLLQESAT